MYILPTVKYLGLQNYAATHAAMKHFTDERSESTPDEIWVMEHEPVFTQGQSGKQEHLLAPGNIPIVQSDRGGQVTYHGPGQILLYPLLALKRFGLGPRSLVSMLENTCIQLLNQYNVAAYAKPHAPGVYVGESKIASIGLRIRKGCSYHGLSLNVDMDLSPFKRINPCGFQNLEMAMLKQFCPSCTVQDVQIALVSQFLKNLGGT